MWYQLSQEQTFVIIRALRALASALYKQRSNTQVFKVQVTNDIVDVESLINWLYDFGINAHDEREAEEIMSYLREKQGRG